MKSIACAAAAAGRALALAQAQSAVATPAADVLLVSSNRTQARLCEHIFDIVAPLDTTTTRRVSCITTAVLAQQAFGSAARQRSMLVRHFLEREPFGRLRPPLDPGKHADSLELVLVQLWELGATPDDLLPPQLRDAALAANSLTSSSSSSSAGLDAASEAALELAGCYERFLEFMEARGSATPRFDVPRTPRPAVIVSDAHALRGADVMLLSRCFPPLGSPAAAQLMLEAAFAAAADAAGSGSRAGVAARPLPLLLLGDARLQAQLSALPAATTPAVHTAAASALSRLAGQPSAVTGHGHGHGSGHGSGGHDMMSLLRAVCALADARAAAAAGLTSSAGSDISNGSTGSNGSDDSPASADNLAASTGAASGWAWSVEAVDELSPDLCSPAVATALRRLTAAASGSSSPASRIVAPSSRSKKAAAAAASADLAASVVDSWPFAVSSAASSAGSSAAASAVRSLTAPLSHAVAYSQRLVLAGPLPVEPSASGQPGSTAAGASGTAAAGKGKGKGKAKSAATAAPTPSAGTAAAAPPSASAAVPGPSSPSGFGDGGGGGDGFLHVLGVAPGGDSMGVLTRVIAAAAAARATAVAGRRANAANAAAAAGATLPPVICDLAAADTIGVLCKSGAHVRQVAAALQEAAALAAAQTGAPSPPFLVRSVSGLRLADVLHVRLLLAALRLTVSLRDAGGVAAATAAAGRFAAASGQAGPPSSSAAPQLDPAAAAFAAAVAAADGDAAADADALFLLLTGDAAGGRGYGMPPALFRAYARAHAAALATGTAGSLGDSKTGVGLAAVGSSAVGLLRWMAAQEAQVAPPAPPAAEEEEEATATRRGGKKAKAKKSKAEAEEEALARNGPASRLLADLRAATADLGRKRSLAAAAATLCRRLGWHRLQAEHEAAAASDDPDGPLGGSNGSNDEDGAAGAFEEDISTAIDGYDAGLSVGLGGLSSAASARARSAAAAGVTQAALAALLRHLQEAEAAARTPRSAPPTSLGDLNSTDSAVGFGPGPDAAAVVGAALPPDAAGAADESLGHHNFETSDKAAADVSIDGSVEVSGAVAPLDAAGIGSIGSFSSGLSFSSGFELPALASAADGSLYVPPTRAGGSGPSATLRLRPDAIAISPSAFAGMDATPTASAGDPSGDANTDAGLGSADGQYSLSAAAATGSASSGSGSASRGAWRAPLSPAALLRGVSRLVFEEGLSLSLSQAGAIAGGGGGGDGSAAGFAGGDVAIDFEDAAAASGDDYAAVAGSSSSGGGGPQALGSLEDALCAPDVDVAVAAAERIVSSASAAAAASLAAGSAAPSDSGTAAAASPATGDEAPSAVRRAGGSGPQVIVVTTLARASPLRFDAAVFAWLPEVSLPGAFRAPQLPAPLRPSAFRVSAAGVLGLSEAEVQAVAAAAHAGNGSADAAAASAAQVAAAASVSADYPPFPLDRDSHTAVQRQRFAELVSRARLGIVALAPARLPRAPATSQRRSRYLDEALGPAPAVTTPPPRVRASSSHAHAPRRHYESEATVTAASVADGAATNDAAAAPPSTPDDTAMPPAVAAQATSTTNAVVPTQQAAAPSKPLTLSVSRLGDYMWCPQRYFLGRNVSLKGAPTAAVLYGRALHSGVEAGGAAVQAWLLQFAAGTADAESGIPHSAASADLRELAASADAAVPAVDAGLAASAALPASAAAAAAAMLPNHQWQSLAGAVAIARRLQACDASAARLAATMLARLPSPQALASLMQAAYDGDWTGTAQRRAYPFGRAPDPSAAAAGSGSGAAAAAGAGGADASLEEAEAPAALLVPGPQAVELRRAAAAAFTRFATAELQELATALQAVVVVDGRSAASAAAAADASAPPASTANAQPVLLRLPAMVEAPFSWWRRVGSAGSAAVDPSAPASASGADWLRLIGIVDRVDIVLPLRLQPAAAAGAAASGPAGADGQLPPLQLLIREFKSGSQWKGNLKGGAAASSAASSASASASMAMTSARHLQLELYADALRSALAAVAGSASDSGSTLAAAARAIEAVAAQVESPETGAAELLPLPRGSGAAASALAPAAAARAAATSPPRYEATVARVAARLRAGDFAATPSAFKCAYCAVQAACAHAVLA